MAPVNGDRNQEAAALATIGVCSTFVLLAIGCACCSKKRKDGQVKEAAKTKANIAPPLVDTRAEAKEPSKGKSLIVEIGKVSDKGPAGKAPAATVDSKKSIRSKSAEIGKAVQTVAKAPVPPPAPSIAPKSAGSIKSAPTTSVKSLRASPAPKTAKSAPAADFIPPPPPGSKSEDFLSVKGVSLLDIKSMPHASVVTPHLALNRPGHALPISKLNLEYVPADNPAYRSLIGLDDAFGGTLKPVDVPDAKKASVDSLMPGSVNTPSTSSSRGFSSASVTAIETKRKQKGEKGKKQKAKKTKKR